VHWLVHARCIVLTCTRSNSYLECFFFDPCITLGTLKAAKRKGLIKFKGQMLFKGMHDHVQIDIVE
jgi:hypothetical protein